jgi:predicted GNAT superfamily acetyltransferase
VTTTATDQPPITVRPLATVAEYRACQEIQRQAWGITEDGYVIPVATLISVQHAGGLVLGAFAGDRLVGFAFGYLGRVRGQWALYSQLTGVDPDVQDRGVGGRLKLAQRAWARDQGLALVAWSYDPLQAGNANFNLHRLGAFSRTYEVDYFGARTDALNAGLDTDRLVVEWPVEDVPRRWQGEGLPAVDLIVAAPRADGLPTPTRLVAAANTEAPELRLDIPPDIGALKARDLELARAWQRAVRAAFRQAFAAGYVAMDFSRAATPHGPRAFYVLRRPIEGAS